MPNFKYIKREWKNGKWRYTYPYESTAKDKKPGVLDKLKEKVSETFDNKQSSSKTDAKKSTAVSETKKPTVDTILKDIGDKPVSEVSAISPRVIAAAAIIVAKIAPVVIAKTAEGIHEVGEKVEAKITEKRAEESREEAAEKVLQDRELADQLSELIKNDPLPNLPVKTEATTPDEDMATINQNYDSGKFAYTNNCSYCTAAYDLRCRGYDVEADAISIFDPPTTVEELASWYDGEVVEDLWDSIKRQDPMAYASGSIDVERAAECLEKDMLRHGDGARGHLCLVWANGGGHDVIWEVSNGEVVIRDCQTNEKLQVYDYLKYARSAEYFRTDNVEPNEKILETVRSRKRKEGAK